MGSLHQGHLSLINRSIVENVQTIITIYVNPTQFNDKNDLNKYPRNLKNDLDKLKHFKNIFIYTPQDKDLYKKVEPKKYDLDDLLGSIVSLSIAINLKNEGLLLILIAFICLLIYIRKSMKRC